MFKFLFTGILVYFIYRFFIAPPALDEDRSTSNDKGQDPEAKKSSHEDEYIDYEEVD